MRFVRGAQFAARAAKSVSARARRGFFVSALLLGACSAAIESSKLEDHVRREVPVPICLKSLERRSTAGVSAATPADYWSLVLPSYDVGSSMIDRSAPDCAGRDVFSDALFQDAEGSRTGMIPAKTDDLLETPGANDFKVLWLRAQHFASGEAAGPLALARPREGHAEVYAIGLYRGNATGSHFSIERLGPRMLVTASDEGCAGVKPGQACQTKLNIFLMNAGQLTSVASLVLDRIEYGLTPGTSGTVQYRMTGTPLFDPKSLRVSEQVVVRDSTETAIRKSNLDRTFVLKGSTLQPSAGSLWDQVVVNTGRSVPPPTAKPTHPR
jgi:hypothetical protein